MRQPRVGLDRAPAHPARAGAGASHRWYALLLALVLSLSWQSVLTHTHEHPASLASSTIAGGAVAAVFDAAPSDGKSAPDQPGNCPVCREIAHGGAYLLPTLAAFDGPIAFRFDAPAAEAVTSAQASRSHAWQSRAPPSLLQA